MERWTWYQDVLSAYGPSSGATFKAGLVLDDAFEAYCR